MLSIAHAVYATYEKSPESSGGFESFHFEEIIPFASDRMQDNEAACGFLAARNDAIVLACHDQPSLMFTISTPPISTTR